MLSLGHIRNTILRSLAIVTMTLAVGCVLLPELDTVSWEKSYSKGHLHGGTFISAFFDGTTEDTDGDGSIKIGHVTDLPFTGLFYSSTRFSLQRQVAKPVIFSRGQKSFLLFRKLLI